MRTRNAYIFMRFRYHCIYTILCQIKYMLCYVLQKGIDSGILLYNNLLILLIFADDKAIIGKTPADVQQQLDK